MHHLDSGGGKVRIAVGAAGDYLANPQHDRGTKPLAGGLERIGYRGLELGLDIVATGKDVLYYTRRQCGFLRQSRGKICFYGTFIDSKIP